MTFEFTSEGATALSIMTHGIMTLIMTLSVMTLSGHCAITISMTTLSIMTPAQHCDTQYNNKKVALVMCPPCVIRLSVIMFTVVAPFRAKA